MATAIEELKLYPKEREKSMDEAVTAFRADAEVHAEGESAFSITVRSRNPETAARAANRLAELYIQRTHHERASQVTRPRATDTQKLTDKTGELKQTDNQV